jgi:lipid II:glycine glycyltransferase (peptidoglycan interpeptide bridge formation enzyme)
LYNQYYEKFAEFKLAVMNFFENIGQYHEQLKTLLTKTFKLLACNKNRKLISIGYIPIEKMLLQNL